MIEFRSVVCVACRVRTALDYERALSSRDETGHEAVSSFDRGFDSDSFQCYRLMNTVYFANEEYVRVDLKDLKAAIPQSEIK